MDSLRDIIRNRWSALEQNDRRAILIGGASVATMLFIGLVIVPSYHSFEGLQKMVPVMKSQLMVMEAQALEATRLRANPAGERNNESLLVVLEKSTSAHDIKSAVQSLTPRSEKSAAVRFKSVEYTKLIKWLAGLNTQYHLNTSEAEITRTGTPGVVDAYLVFAG